MIPLLGVVAEPYSHEARFGLFLLATLVLIAGSWFLVRRVRDHELILLGLVVAAAAMGYGLSSATIDANAPNAPSVSLSLALGSGALAGTLMKIAAVLVLAGAARSLLLACSAESASDAPKP